MEEFFCQEGSRIERWLDRLVPSETDPPGLIHEAMRYSLFAGGKRLRPILAIVTGELYEVPEETLLPAACSLEMIHTYSLIHDDLPAMDDDDLRRGMPTSHVRYGEAIAILAGDALLTRAFQTLAELRGVEPGRLVRVIGEVAQAAGTTQALIGGQVLDLQSEGKVVSSEALEAIHRAKTGALIRCAVRLGPLLGGAAESELAALTVYGEKIGLAFQIADDLLDETATTEELGKTAGKDLATDKATYAALYGISEATRLAQEVTASAIEALQSLPRTPDRLAQIARFIVDRRS
ncbi:MAG: polyprenyl synthetase family protein [Blastocatellia bacterium]|jgi:geranylgeranyl pyrophosphate synthase